MLMNGYRNYNVMAKKTSLDSNSEKSYRIYIGPGEVAGVYLNLAQGLRNCGHKCDFIPLYSHPSQYETHEKSPLLVVMLRYLNSFKFTKKWQYPLKVAVILTVYLLSMIWLCLTLFRYDIFIFSFGNSLMRHNSDLPILRFFKKTIICNIAHGSEARPPFISGGHRGPHGETLYSPEELWRYTSQVHDNVRRVERYADFVIGAPPSSSQFGIRKQINHYALGMPCQVDVPYQHSELQNKPVGVDLAKEPIVILHSPSHPFIKGTKLIQTAIDNLISQGYHIDFRLVSGQPHKVVMQQLKTCDFVVDQLYSDTPMAGFGSEAAWHSKPCVIAGYAFGWVENHFPEDMVPPSYTCQPDDIEAAIKDLIDNPDKRHKLGKQAHDFVKQKWERTEVAKRWVKLIQNDVPKEWWFSPSDCAYLMGCGQSIEVSQNTINQQIGLFGVESLCVSHNPALEAALIEFAQQNVSSDD